MNKKRVSTQFLLYFLIMMFLMVIGCGGGGSGPLPTYNISGYVKLNNVGLEGVTITLIGPSPGSTTTDHNGNYSYKGVSGTYTVVPSMATYEFDPISRVVVVNYADVTDQNFAATNIGSTPTYTISGTVTGASDVILTLTGDETGAFSTRLDGTFSFTVVNGSYTIRPSKTGYKFDPISLAAIVKDKNIAGNNFAATYIGSTPTYTISGTVTGAVLKGVKIILKGDANGSVATISDGTYSFPPVVNGTYYVVPYMAGYTFHPISRVVVVNGADVTDQNFAAGYIGSVSTYTISGTVTLIGTGKGLKNVTITLGGDNTGAVTTGPNGSYSFPPLLTGSYTVKPYLKGYSFTPYNRIITLNGDSPGNDFTATSGAYTQADVTGTWVVHMLNTGYAPGDHRKYDGWVRGYLTFDSSGNLADVDCRESAGNTATCPAKNTLTWTINSSTGVITESGTSAGTASHITMSSNKNFITGTDGGTDVNGDTKVKLMIAQKYVTGTSYQSYDFLMGDLANITFVYHQLTVGPDNGWSHGTGSALFGNALISSETDSSGGFSVNLGGQALSVDTKGVVTMSGACMCMTNFNGFLSDDKKTIVGTVNDGSDYTLLIIQITSSENNENNFYTVGALPAGTMFDHILAIGADVPFWAHTTVTVDSNGTMTFANNWVSSASSISAPATAAGNITASGGVTITGSPTFDGQISDDGLFMVGTQTFSTGVYSLSVFTN